LAETVGELVGSGRFGALGTEGAAFHELSRSRLRGYGDPQLPAALLGELRARKLARELEAGEDGSMPVPPLVRSAAMVLLAQFVRPKGEDLGVELSPVTDHPPLADALCEVLSLSQFGLAGGAVAFDLETVSPDLSHVPLGEVLDFRRQHHGEYRRYARTARGFVGEIGGLPARESDKGFRDRQEELRELAADLRRAGWKAWRMPASFGLTVAGAAWTLADDPVGALLAAAAGKAAGPGADGGQGAAYSYMFTARSRYG
jgi:hypothetical protein